jgi:hypothetical protein
MLIARRRFGRRKLGRKGSEGFINKTGSVVAEYAG